MIRRYILSMLSVAALSAAAESLLVNVNGVTYSYPAEQTGEMIFNDATTLTILGKAYNLNEVSSLAVEDSSVESNSINIVYNESSATAVVDGMLASHVDISVNGAHVSVTQHSDYTEEITYTLSGSSSNGSFLTSGSYKSTIRLEGLTLTNPSGAALSIQNGKRNNLSVKEGTVNSLTDGSGSQKGCLTCKGHLEIKGKGALTVSSKYAHGIHASEYITLKNATITVTAAVKDGVNCNQYFAMESGSLTISGVGDEGIQVSYKDETNPEAEDTASLTVSGGTITTTTTGKGIKADGNITISGGTINVTASGSGAEGIESKQVLRITGGEIYVKAYDDGINSGSHMYIAGGNVKAISQNNDGLDSNGNLYLSDGTVFAAGGRSPECGIDANEERGYSVIFTGGTLIAIGGGNSTPSTSESTQAYVSSNLSVTAGAVIELKSGNEVLAAFTVPQGYSSTGSSSGGSQGGWGGGRPGGGGGFGPGGNSGSGLLITCPELVSGSSYTISNGSSSATATARLR